jgi:hypothetical protein
MKKANSFIPLITVVFLFGAFNLWSADSRNKEDNRKSSFAKNGSFNDEKGSIGESKPMEIDSVRVQILDKISGKVYRESIKSDVPKIFGSLRLKLKKCFQNGPENNAEIFAFIEISEKNEIIFSDWIFASSPSINLFSHPVYDIRVEFPHES